MADVPSGGSGLLVRDCKGKKANRLITRIDPGVVSLVAELRRRRRNNVATELVGAIGSIPNNAKGLGDREGWSALIQPLLVHLSSGGTSCISSRFRTSTGRYAPSAHDVRASVLPAAIRDACRSPSAHRLPYTRRIPL